ncbi:hypothetical protein [Thiorhodococcus minor]|uniref:Helix-turn-helix domain-containing protein n=1 Tax=Thiorhodococcus minor TaxID=57489 RepID=A0A6M0K7N6_9GAMM|nr:hypothetical protein [Thiorhodococcus minor]NEV64943.1 hypothetical protein [Thiorhodococcus minor]
MDTKQRATRPSPTHPETELLNVLKTTLLLSSDAQVAAFLGITRATIHRVRHGQGRLGIQQRLKILDHIGFLDNRLWLNRLRPDRLNERIRRSGHALRQRQVRAPQRIERDLSIEGKLLDLVQDACGFRTDTELAEFLDVARITLSNGRAGRGSLGPRQRLRILNRFAPFDTERIDAVLDSTEVLIEAVREWADHQRERAGQDRANPSASAHSSADAR